jgi:hypothetical protein
VRDPNARSEADVPRRGQKIFQQKNICDTHLHKWTQVGVEIDSVEFEYYFGPLAHLARAPHLQ